MGCTIRVAKTKALISFAVTAKLICVFVFAYAKIRFSHDAAHLTLGKLSSLDYLQTHSGEVVRMYCIFLSTRPQMTLCIKHKLPKVASI